MIRRCHGLCVLCVDIGGSGNVCLCVLVQSLPSHSQSKQCSHHQVLWSSVLRGEIATQKKLVEVGGGCLRVSSTKREQSCDNK